MYNKGLQANAVDSVHTLLHPTFQLAIRDGILRLNPTDGVMNEIKKGKDWIKPKKMALTIPQQTALIRFLENHNEYVGCNAFKMMRHQSLIDYAKFDAYVASFFREEEEIMQRKIENEDPKLCWEVNLGNKKYVRYHEGAYLYSLGKKGFTDLAKKTDAVRKIGGVSLVSVEKLNEYIEKHFG
jgi:hypothetical protein